MNPYEALKEFKNLIKISKKILSCGRAIEYLSACNNLERRCLDADRLEVELRSAKQQIGTLTRAIQYLLEKDLNIQEYSIDLKASELKVIGSSDFQDQGRLHRYENLEKELIEERSIKADLLSRYHTIVKENNALRHMLESACKRTPCTGKSLTTNVTSILENLK